MGEKTVLMDIEEKMLRYDAAVLLRKLADDLAQGCVTAQEGTVAVGDTVKVECKGKLKAKDGGTKGCLEIELSWVTPA